MLNRVGFGNEAIASMVAFEFMTGLVCYKGRWWVAGVMGEKLWRGDGEPKKWRAIVVGRG